MSRTLHPSLLIKISSSKFGHQFALHTDEHAFYIRNTHASMRFTWGTYAKIVRHNNHSDIYSVK